MGLYRLTLVLKTRFSVASVSVMANIAEGFERGSKKEYRHFLNIAKGSCGEVRSLLYIIQDNGYYSEQDIRNIQNESLQISRILSSLMLKLKAES